MDTILIFFYIGLLLFLGYFYELIFKKYHVSDLILLILTGILIGPYGFKIIGDNFKVSNFLIQFVLVFLVFDGALRINLKTLVKQMTNAFKLSLLSFIFSSASVTIIVYFFMLHAWGTSILLGLMLGGVSSIFIVALLEKLAHLNQNVYSAELLEGTLTDVYTIVFSIAMMNILNSSFNLTATISTLINLFALGMFIGILSGVFWLKLVDLLFKDNYYYMVTIAYLFLIYAFTETIGGNGVIAALFFGITLKNSRKIAEAGAQLIDKDVGDVFKVTSSEKFFYSQISFFIKVFFFIYMGALLRFDKFTLFGFLTAIILAFVRVGLVHLFKFSNKRLLSSLFGRGIAAAVIVELAIEKGVLNAGLRNYVFSTVIFTILLSSFFFLLYLHYSSTDHSSLNSNRSNQSHFDSDVSNISNSNINKHINKKQKVKA